MNPEMQQPVVAQIHQFAQKEHKTCIECHKAIAHKLPEGA
jgi:nitrate/TMAO reductase-like tetraheme cytochrome c subunit